ncbi:MAG: signal peptidase I [Gammaproteobacteria bacterium]|nr:signal peptidase I [Gammaproteobacteria bacterium]
MDFALILVVAAAVTGVIWLLDSVFFLPKRNAAIAGVTQAGGELDPKLLERVGKEPVIVEYAKSFFPIILIVLVIRSFLFEPFRIPSGSMKPTLLVGDFILVNKFTYGLRLPVLHNKFLTLGEPQRGDIVVFRYPLDPSNDYIKRVVGLAGDRVVYQDKNLYLQKACPMGTAPDACPKPELIQRVPAEPASFDDEGREVNVFEEELGGVKHHILVDPNRPGDVFGLPSEWVVPEGHFFVMGDNRDNSRDSRFWGFVPEENLVGEAVGIWFNLNFKLGRIGGIE